MSSPVSINLNRGSDLAWIMVLTNAAGAPVNITGWTFPVVAVVPAVLTDNVSCTVTDGPNGQMSLSLPWSAEWPTGEGTRVSIRIRPSALSEAFPEIQVNLQ